MKQERLYTKELLEKIVPNSNCISDVCRNLGKRASGGTHELIKSRIIEYNIDISHFNGNEKYNGKNSKSYKERRKKEEILVDGLIKRRSHRELKRALIESGIKYKCNICNINSWQGKEITLDVDHIDGNWSDSRIENLRFLCPNCHRQTDTFCKIKIKKEKKTAFCKCGNIMYFKANQCNSCKRESMIKNKINFDELQKDVWLKPIKHLSKKYNYSDSRLLKICKLNNINLPPKGYWNRKNKHISNINLDTFKNDLSISTLDYMYKKYNMSKDLFLSFCKENNIDILTTYKKKVYNQYTGKFRSTSS